LHALPILGWGGVSTVGFKASLEFKSDPTWFATASPVPLQLDPVLSEKLLICCSTGSGHV